MTIQEVLLSGKKARRKSQEGSRFRVLKLEKLSKEEILADDWEIEREPKIYWLGMTKIQSHTKQVSLLRAIEAKTQTEIDSPPDAKTSDGTVWIKVVEVT